MADAAGMSENHISTLNVGLIESICMLFRNEVVSHLVVEPGTQQMLPANDWDALWNKGFDLDRRAKRTHCDSPGNILNGYRWPLTRHTRAPAG